MNSFPWASVVGFLGIISGYLLRYYLDKKKELVSENTAIKRSTYKEFTDIVVELFKTTKINDDVTHNEKLNKVVEKLSNFYKNFLLYASPELVIAFGEFMQHLYAQDKTKDHHNKFILLLSKVIKTMRSDLDLSNKDLGEYGENLFRPLLKDFDSISK